MKIKFNSDDDLPLNKTLELHNMTIVVRVVFRKGFCYLKGTLLTHNVISTPIKRL